MAARRVEAARDRARRATDAYLGDEDAIARWVEECCAVDSDLFPNSGAALFANLEKSWAEAVGEFVGSQKAIFHRRSKIVASSGAAREGQGNDCFLGLRAATLKRAALH